MVSPYSKNSAGSRMIEKEFIPLVFENQTIKEAQDYLKREIRNIKTINYLYVIDGQEKLIGVITIKELFRQRPETKISEIMKKELITIHPSAHQEKVVILAIKHNLKAIPVVDKENHLLGVVPSDNILSILHKEHIEDALLSVGIHKFKDPAKSIIEAPAFLHFKKRLPWLILGLIGGMIAAIVVSSFEESLKVKIILAAFIPAVVYMADAVGAQTQTIFIRSLAIEHKLNLRKYIWREIRVGFYLALMLGIVIAFISFLWQKSLLLSSILGLSFFLTIIMAMAVAITLPLFFLKIKQDPAVTSGPFATIVRDVLSLLVYFTICSLLL